MSRAEEHSTTAWKCAIDLAELRRLGLSSGLTTWSTVAGPYASVRWHLGTDALSLQYEANGSLKVERITFGWSAMHFGGSRQWLCCLGCGRNARIVYLGSAGYRCRQCYDLRYASQREAGHDRAISMAQKLRTKLGGSANLMDPFPAKPPFMRWRTYDRLIERDRQLTNAWGIGVRQKWSAYLAS